jgi:hypothetical protein
MFFGVHFVEIPPKLDDRLFSDRRRAVQEKRTTFRKRVLKNAQIILSDKAPKLECAVRNISDAGACLQVSTTYGIPANFDVIFEGIRRPCRSIWRTDTKIGIMFE